MNCPGSLLPEVTIFFFEVISYNGLNHATVNPPHKKNQCKDGATCYDTHPTAPLMQRKPSQGHADSSVKSNPKGIQGLTVRPHTSLCATAVRRAPVAICKPWFTTR